MSHVAGTCPSIPPNEKFCRLATQDDGQRHDDPQNAAEPDALAASSPGKPEQSEYLSWPAIPVLRMHGMRMHDSSLMHIGCYVLELLIRGIQAQEELAIEKPTPCCPTNREVI